MAKTSSCEIILSYGAQLGKKSLPLSSAQLKFVFSETLKALRKDAKYEKAAEKLGPALKRLGLYLCSDSEMRMFQINYRKLDRTTDVLSFPCLEMYGDDLSYLPVSELSLGDLIVSLSAVQRGAVRGKRSVRDEFLEVFIHGILHLLGYDHVRTNARVGAAQAQKMRTLQKTLFLDLRSKL